MKKLCFYRAFAGMFMFFLFASLPLISQTSTKGKVLTDSEKIFGLSALCTEVKYNYTFYEQLTFDWDSLCRASIEQVIATETLDEYARELQRICAMLGDGHTSVENVSESDPADWIKPLPFTTRFLDGKVIVEEVLSSELLEQGIERGTEIVTLEGVPAVEYGEKYLLPYLSSSSPQWSISGIYEGFAFTKDKGSKDATVTFRGKKGKVFTYTLDRNVDWDIQRTQDNSPYLYRTLSGNIGLLRIRHFNSNGMTKLFDEIYEEKILKTDALIIDLRNNGGGNSLNAEYILRHLSERSFRGNGWSSPMHIAAYASWDYPAQRYMTEGEVLWPVRKEIYKKPVIVLVNGGTFSSAEDFCAIFKGMNRGVIVGTPTAGSTGNAVRRWLVPGLIEVSICSKTEISPDGISFIGTGVLPHVECVETLSGFLNEEDDMIVKALQLWKE